MRPIQVGAKRDRSTLVVLYLQGQFINYCYYFYYFFFFDSITQAIGYNCHQLQSLNLGWCDRVGDEGVKSLAYDCPDLRALDLCGCVLITGIPFVLIHWLMF